MQRYLKARIVRGGHDGDTRDGTDLADDAGDWLLTALVVVSATVVATAAYTAVTGRAPAFVRSAAAALKRLVGASPRTGGT